MCPSPINRVVSAYVGECNETLAMGIGIMRPPIMYGGFSLFRFFVEDKQMNTAFINPKCIDNTGEFSPLF